MDRNVAICTCASLQTVWRFGVWFWAICLYPVPSESLRMWQFLLYLYIDVTVHVINYFLITNQKHSRSQWPRGLRRRSTAARLLRSWVRIPPRAWMFVCCECCVLSGRGLCDGLIIRSEESYRLWRVVVCDQVTSYARRLKPTRGLENTTPSVGCSARKKKKRKTRSTN